MLKDFQVKTISKDVAAPENLLKKRLEYSGKKSIFL